jgi:hypothetical protein
MTNNWMKKAFSKNPGMLHKQLGYPASKILPPALIRDIAHANVGVSIRGHRVTPLLKHRALAAWNAKK